MLWAKHNGKWGVLTLNKGGKATVDLAYNDLFEYGFQNTAFRPDRGEFYKKYLDMNADGTDELLICSFEEDGRATWDIYGYVNGVTCFVGGGDNVFNAVTKAVVIDNQCVYVSWEGVTIAANGSSGEDYYIFDGSIVNIYEKDSYGKYTCHKMEPTGTRRDITEEEYLAATFKFNPEKGIKLEPSIMARGR